MNRDGGEVGIEGERGGRCMDGEEEKGGRGR